MAKSALLLFALVAVPTSACLLFPDLSGFVCAVDCDSGSGTVDTGMIDTGVVTDAAMDSPMSDAGSTPPITWVQGNAEGTDWAPDASGSMASVSLGAPLRPHDAIIVAFTYSWNGALAPLPGQIADTLGNTYAIVAGPAPGQYVAAAFNTVPGQCKLTVAIDGAISSLWLSVQEYSGLALSSAFDVSAFASGSTDMAGTDEINSGAAMTSNTTELIVGFVSANNTVDPGTGFTHRSNWNVNGTMVEDQTVMSAGSYQATGSPESACTWRMLMTTFKGQGP